MSAAVGALELLERSRDQLVKAAKAKHELLASLHGICTVILVWASRVVYLELVTEPLLFRTTDGTSPEGPPRISNAPHFLPTRSCRSCSILHSLVAMSWLLACSSWVARQRRRVDELLDDLLHREVRDEPLGLKAPKDLELVTEAASEHSSDSLAIVWLVC